ncbi:MAG: hypothetical protein ACJ754_27415 [Pyrinomonadaceae bacterium]
MKRSSLLIFMLASVVAGSAWRAHAGGASASGASGFPPVPAPTASRKIDEYGTLRWRDEKQRLDNYLIELRNDPTARACIICYGGRRSRAGEARGRCARVAGYLKHAGIDPARIVNIDGGFREEVTVELWTPSFGSALPMASPTVDPSEVTVIKNGQGGKRKPRRR